MTAYHHPRAKHARSLQARSMPAAALALWACDATRVSTPGFLRVPELRAPMCSDTKRRDENREVDSMAEVNGS